MNKFLIALVSTGLISLGVMSMEIRIYESLTEDWSGACSIPETPNLPSVLAVWAALMSALIATGHLL